MTKKVGLARDGQILAATQASTVTTTVSARERYSIVVAAHARQCTALIALPPSPSNTAQRAVPPASARRMGCMSASRLLGAVRAACGLGIEEPPHPRELWLATVALGGRTAAGPHQGRDLLRQVPAQGMSTGQH